MTELQLDEVGYWTEIKLDILRDYSRAYTTILKNQRSIKHFAYIDGFAGAGTHISKATGREIEGSPSIALNADTPFSHYHFIDLDGQRIDRLRKIAGEMEDVSVYEGDCNSILLDQVLPQCQYKDYRRALCILDPYKLNPDWEVVQTAGKMGSIEIFLTFMIMDANMNVLWKNPDKVTESQIERMNDFWGDNSWRDIAYTKERGLFGDIEEKADNQAIVDAYRKRLREQAGFKYAPEPMPMINSRGAVIYYLFFASQNEIGAKIAQAIFNKYKERGLSHGI